MPFDMTKGLGSMCNCDGDGRWHQHPIHDPVEWCRCVDCKPRLTTEEIAEAIQILQKVLPTNTEADRLLELADKLAGGREYRIRRQRVNK